jgi:hypothetical protein
MSRHSLLGAVVALVAIACNSPSSDEPDGGKKPVADARAVSCSDAGGGMYFPCDVGPIIHAKCQRCHDRPEALQSCVANDSCAEGPFPLATWSDTRRSFGDGERVVDLLEGVIARGEMPYVIDSIQPPVQTLTADEKATLLAWTRSCAPAVATPCPP